MTFQTKIKRLDYLNTSYLLIPKSVVDELGGISRTRLICTVNDALSFQCGLVALGEGQAYISINSQRMKQLGLQLGDTAEVTLEPDHSKYGMEVPEELAEVLRQDPEGEDRFNKLPPGKRRYIIFYVSSVKSSQLRIDRSLLLIGNLKGQPQGKETFRGILGIVK